MRTIQVCILLTVQYISGKHLECDCLSDIDQSAFKQRPSGQYISLQTSPLGVSSPHTYGTSSGHPCTMIGSWYPSKISMLLAISAPFTPSSRQRCDLPRRYYHLPELHSPRPIDLCSTFGPSSSPKHSVASSKKPQPGNASMNLPEDDAAVIKGDDRLLYTGEYTVPATGVGRHLSYQDSPRRRQMRCRSSRRDRPKQSSKNIELLANERHISRLWRSLMTTQVLPKGQMLMSRVLLRHVEKMLPRSTGHAAPPRAFDARLQGVEYCASEEVECGGLARQHRCVTWFACASGEGYRSYSCSA